MDLPNQNTQIGIGPVFLNKEFKFDKTQYPKNTNWKNYLQTFLLNNYRVERFSRDHVLFLAHVLRSLDPVSTHYKKAVAGLIMLNYTLSNKEKKSLYKKHGINFKAQSKNLLNFLISRSDVFLNQPIRRNDLKYLVSFLEIESKSSLNFYLAEHRRFGGSSRVSRQSSLNLLSIAFLVKKYKPSCNVKIFDRYSFYCQNFGKNWVVKGMECYGIVKKEEFQKDYFVQEQTRLGVSSRSIWNSSYANQFSSISDFSKNLDYHKDFIFETFNKHLPFMEAFEGFKDPLKARDLLVERNNRFIVSKVFSEIPTEGPLKVGLEKVFGFHSSNLINYLSEVSKTKSARVFLNKFYQGSLAPLVIKSKKTDYLWRFLKVDMDTSEIAFLAHATYAERTSFLSEEQQLALWESKEESSFMELQDTVRSLTPEVIEIVKNLSFNERNTWKKFHDVVSREYTRLKNPKKDLGLSKMYPSINQLNKKVLSSGHKLVVPQSNHDLIHWGASLRICVGSYADKVSSGNSLVLGVEKEGIIAYCIEFSRQPGSSFVGILGSSANLNIVLKFQVVQFKGASNVNGPQDLKEEVVKEVTSVIEKEFLEFVPYKKVGGLNPFLIIDDLGQWFQEPLRAQGLERIQIIGRNNRGRLPDIDIDMDEEE